MELNLMPKISRIWPDNYLEHFKFMGCYAKNREEWTVTDLAAMGVGATIIAFYDTLGPEAVEFVIKQTQLTTISCDQKYLRSIIMLKSQGRAASIDNLVSFDEDESIEEIRADAKQVGIKLYTYR